MPEQRRSRPTNGTGSNKPLGQGDQDSLADATEPIIVGLGEPFDRARCSSHLAVADVAVEMLRADLHRLLKSLHLATMDQAEGDLRAALRRFIAYGEVAARLLADQSDRHNWDEAA